MSGSPEPALSNRRRIFLGFYLRNLGANVLGFATIAVLNALTPLEFFRVQRAILLYEGEWREFFLFYPLVLGLVAILQYWVQQPVAAMARDLEQEREPGEAQAIQARRRLINLPYITALVNLCVYLAVPAAISATFYLWLNAPPRISLFVFIRAFMIGGIAAGLSFFLVEDHARRTLVPAFFPEGRLVDVAGAIRIPLSRRIRMLYASGTSIPMVILLVTLFFAAWEAGRDGGIGAEAFARGVFAFTVALCLIFLVIALRLNFLVQRSIVEPLQEMLAAVRRIRSGDYGRRIQVLSNDELGVLGDAGNQMIDALEERRRIRKAFGRYVTPEIRDEIMAGKIPLDGERREATLLFVDLRGFTSYVEANEPEEVIRSMRSYFTAMEAAVRAHSGIVLQYVGDEMESVFGVPLHDPEHADRAVRAALEMRRNLEALNRERERGGKSPFRHGIGIHTGMVLAGITGSDKRLSYALIGDTVNLAARIEDLARDLEADILVSGDTARRLERSYDLEELPPRRVKGYSKPITVLRVR
ncbi:MAG: HAMP domain-containing protein [Deltaproteobacteria bacterium]|nr:HAMP domain-containing protein [Deltaproteobacteria bacterium]